MPSRALTDHLERLLADADALCRAYAALRSDRRMVTGDLVALPRAVVVMCVSAWEAYIEELVRESLLALRPSGSALGAWPALNASARAAIGRFNTPNTDQVRGLISDCLGLQDVQSSWAWQNNTPAQSRERLQQAMEYRHQVAHGVNPRPVVDMLYARPLATFFRRLSRCTDDAVRTHLVAMLGVPDPWPE